MKNIIFAFVFTLFLISCGESSNTKKEQTTADTALNEEETAKAEEISSELQSDINELQKSTEKNLQEVDSLLEKL